MRSTDEIGFMYEWHSTIEQQAKNGQLEDFARKGKGIVHRGHDDGFKVLPPKSVCRSPVDDCSFHHTIPKPKAWWIMNDSGLDDLDDFEAQAWRGESGDETWRKSDAVADLTWYLSSAAAPWTWEFFWLLLQGTEGEYRVALVAARKRARGTGLVTTRENGRSIFV